MIRLGIDIGGTKTHAVAIDSPEGEVGTTVVAEVQLETGQGNDAVVASAVQVVEALAQRAGVAVADLASIGVGVPGVVDYKTGRVVHAVNLGVEALELGAVMRGLVDVDVRVDNDVNAAALGAYHLGGGDIASMAYLNLGTGVAAGLVLDGRLWRGAGGIAGEIGHIPIDPRGDVCRCGQRGCLEVYASGSGVARRWVDGAGGTVSALFEAADRGEAEAVRLRDELVVAVASAVRILVLTADVDEVVVGGGVSALGERLRIEVAGVLDGWAAASPFLASAALSSRLRIVPDRSVTAAVGAALVAML